MWHVYWQVSVVNCHWQESGSQGKGSNSSEEERERSQPLNWLFLDGLFDEEEVILFPLVDEFSFKVFVPNALPVVRCFLDMLAENTSPSRRFVFVIRIVHTSHFTHHILIWYMFHPFFGRVGTKANGQLARKHPDKMGGRHFRDEIFKRANNQPSPKGTNYGNVML
jgi:hypothetical protein